MNKSSQKKPQKQAAVTSAPVQPAIDKASVEIEASPMAVRRTVRRRANWFLVLSLCIAAFTTALHLPSLKGALITDDVVLVSDFDRRGCGADPAECFSNLIGHFYYRPMLSASFALGQKFHNNDPIWFHTENLVMHFLAVLAAIAAFRMLFRRRTTALIAGSILALHPFNVTVTSWIGGRTDTMALGFMALYALGVMQAGRRIRLRQRLRRQSPKFALQTAAWIGISSIALLASVFTKEQSMGLLFLAPMLAGGFKGGRRTKRPFPYWTALYLIPVLIFAYVAHNVLQTLDFDHADWSAAQHFEMVGRTLAYYTSEFFAPTIGDQHVSTIGPWNEQQIVRAVVGYSAAIAWCVLLAKRWRHRPTRLCMLWASLCIGPVLNVIPIPNALAAPFRTAVAMFGVAGLLALALSQDESAFQLPAAWAAKFPHARRVVLSCLLGWYLIVTVRDVPNWLSEWSYVQAQVAADPNFVCARASVASGELLRGHNEEALKQFDICVEMLFGKDTPTANYTAMLRAPQMLPVMQSMSTLRYRPMQYIPQVIRERGRALLALKRYDEAIDNLRVVLQISPTDIVARESMVACYRALGKNDRADAVQRMDDVLSGRPL